MCISFGQKEFKYKDILTQNKKWNRISSLLKQMNPNSYRVNLWSEGVIIAQNKEPDVRKAQFAWLEEKKDGKTWPVFNVRSEGGWINKSNDPNYKGPYHIYKNPYVKDLLQFQRCVIPCDFFIEQPNDKKIDKKFLIRKNDCSLIHLGGVYKETLNEDTGELKTYFSIITTPPTPATEIAQHHRSPLIIDDQDIFTFLSNDLKGIELNQFFKPHHSKNFEVYEVDADITKKKVKYENDDNTWIQPIGKIIPVNNE